MKTAIFRRNCTLAASFGPRMRMGRRHNVRAA